MAENGGSPTLRGPYDPQTGFEDPSYPSLQSTRLQKFQQSQALKVCVVVSSWSLSFVAHGQKADTPGKPHNAPDWLSEPAASFNSVKHKHFSTAVRELSVSSERGDGNDLSIKNLSNAIHSRACRVSDRFAM